MRTQGLTCLCGNTRMAARAISSVYDRKLAAVGLRSSQMALLWAVYGCEPVTASKLGTTIAMDKTTLARSLRLLEADGLIVLEVGRDRRKRYARLTEAGRDRFDRAIPHWQEAQAEMRSALGDAAFDAFVGAALQVARAAPPEAA
jgi:DNA-binding MarR family transcriptional regulator